MKTSISCSCEVNALATKLQVMEIAERALDLWAQGQVSEARALKDLVRDPCNVPNEGEGETLAKLSQRFALRHFQGGKFGRDPKLDSSDMAQAIAIRLHRSLHGSKGHWRALLSAIRKSVPIWDESGLGDARVSGNHTLVRGAIAVALAAPWPEEAVATVWGEAAFIGTADYYAKKAVLAALRNRSLSSEGVHAFAMDVFPDGDDSDADDPDMDDGLENSTKPDGDASARSGSEVSRDDTFNFSSDRLRAETIIRGLGNPGRPLNVRLARLRARDEEVIQNLLDWNPDNQPETQLLWDVAIGRRPGLAVHQGPLAAGEAARSLEELAHAMHRLSGLVDGGAEGFHPSPLDPLRPGDDGDEGSLFELDVKSAFPRAENAIGVDPEALVIENEKRDQTATIFEETISRLSSRDQRILRERMIYMQRQGRDGGFAAHMPRLEKPDLEQFDAEERRRLDQAVRTAISVAGMRLEDALVARFRDRLLDYLAQSARRRAVPRTTGTSTVTTMALGLHLKHLGTRPRKGANALTWSAMQALLTAEDDDHIERPWSGEQDRAEQGKFITWLGKQFSTLVAAYHQMHGHAFWVD